MEAHRTWTWEHICYMLAFALALMLRWRGLGQTPLSDAEAALALQALGVAQGQPVAVGGQPGYVLPTALLFALGGAGDALARLWPAWSGALLAALPYFWRDRLGRLPALMLAFGLALDPGLVAASRLADGLMPALVCGLAALTAWRWGIGWAAGAWLLLAVLGGPPFWLGLLALGLAVGAVRLLEGELPDWPHLSVKALGSGALVVLLVVGMLFLRAPQALSGLGSGLVTFLRGWKPPAQVPLPWMLGACLDEWLPLLLALVGVAVGWRRDAFVRLIGLWMAFSLLVTLAYPAARVADLSWFLIPLWCLAAMVLARLGAARYNSPVVWGTAALAFLLLTFAWFDLAALHLAPVGHEALLRWGVLGGTLALLALLILLIGAGWSWYLARDGVLLGVTLFGSLFLLRGAWQPEPSLWQPIQAGQVRLLVDTLGDVSEWNYGRRDALPLMLQNVDAPSLRWALRVFPLKEVRGFEPAALPEAVLRPASAGDLSRPAAYRGQSFLIAQRPNWDGRWVTLLNWLVLRRLPWASEEVVLWVRGDHFPGGSLALQGEPTTPLEQPLDIPAR